MEDCKRESELASIKVEIRAFPRALSREEIIMLSKGHRPFYCKRCDLWFMSRSELMKHIWEVHRRRSN